MNCFFRKDWKLKTEYWLSIFLVMMLLVIIQGCGDSSGSSTDSSSSSSSSDSSDDASDDSSDSSTGSDLEVASFAVSVAKDASTYNTEDIVENISFEYIIYVDFSNSTARLGSGTEQTITTNAITVLEFGDTNVTFMQTDYGISLNSTVDADIIYNLSGELVGTLTVSSNNPYQLYLDGVTITGSAGPALDLESSQKAFIVAADDTLNTLTDAADREMTMKAAVYGKGPIIFSGQGAIDITGDYKHGIFSKDYIRISGGQLDVTVSQRDAVRSVNGFIFDDGNLTLFANGSATDDESKGIKVEGQEDADGAGKGYVVVNGGYITITSVSKAITAGWDIDDDAETTATSDDPNPYVEINNGVIDIVTTGTPYEYTLDGETVSLSPEGIEAKSNLVINSGYITAFTTDDSLNAGSDIDINGGYVYCISSRNDAIDANGELTIAGGVIVAIGSLEPEGAFDCDQNTFAITGGTFVGIGGALSEPTESACTGNAIILGSLTTGSTMALKADDGTVAFAFTIPQSYSIMLLSSPLIETGGQYTVYSGGTASANQIFYGLYLGDLTYTQGSAANSFTVSSCITNLGTSMRRLEASAGL